MTALSIFCAIYILVGLVVGVCGFSGLYAARRENNPARGAEEVVKHLGVGMVFALVVLLWPYCVTYVWKNRNK